MTQALPKGKSGFTTFVGELTQITVEYKRGPRRQHLNGHYHIQSTSPLGPVAMTGPSSSPNVSRRLRHCILSHDDQSVFVMAAFVIRFAALQYGQSREYSGRASYKCYLHKSSYISEVPPKVMSVEVPPSVSERNLHFGTLKKQDFVHLNFSVRPLKSQL